MLIGVPLLRGLDCIQRKVDIVSVGMLCGAGYEQLLCSSDCLLTAVHT